MNIFITSVRIRNLSKSARGYFRRLICVRPVLGAVNINYFLKRKSTQYMLTIDLTEINQLSVFQEYIS